MDNSVYSFAPFGSYQTQHSGSPLHVHVPHEQDKTSSFTQVVLSPWMHHLEVWKMILFGYSVLNKAGKALKVRIMLCWLNSLGNDSQVKILCNDFSVYMLNMLEIALPGPRFEVLFSDVCYLFPSWNLLPSMSIHMYLRLYNSCYQSFQMRYCSCLCRLLLSL